MRKRWFLGGIVGLLSAFSCFVIFQLAAAPRTATITPTLPSNQDTQRPIVAHPVKFTVPSIALTAPIEEVGRTPEGDMDVPRREDILGWYKFGPFPGNIGSAVLAGHTGRPDRPAPFRKLELLKKDDVLQIEDVHGSVILFKITQIARYPATQAPRERIFGETSHEQLVLITCTGDWIEERETYSDRLVIYGIRQS